MKKRIISMLIAIVATITLFPSIAAPAVAAETYFTATHSSGLEFTNLSDESVTVHSRNLYAAYEFARYLPSGEVISGNKDSAIAASDFILQAGERRVISASRVNGKVDFYLPSGTHGNSVTVKVSYPANVHFKATYPSGLEFTNLTDAKVTISAPLYSAYNYTRYNSLSGEVSSGRKSSVLAASGITLNVGDRWMITPIGEGRTVEFYYATEIDNVRIRTKNLSSTEFPSTNDDNPNYCKNGHSFKSANGHSCTACDYAFSPVYTTVSKTLYATKNNVPVWDAPYSKSGKIVGKLDENQAIKVLKQFDNSVDNLWYVVEYNGNERYIYSENLTATKPVRALPSTRDTVPNTNNKYYYSSGNVFYNSGLAGQCTWYAYGRAWEITGERLPFINQAESWWRFNESNKYFPSGQEPRAGAIAVWGATTNNPNGHVAIIEKIEGSTIYFSEANYNYDKAFHYAKYAGSGQRQCEICQGWGGRVDSTVNFLGYIYIF